MCVKNFLVCVYADDVDLKCEAELLGTLHHPHIVMLIESFVYQNRQVGSCLFLHFKAI